MNRDERREVRKKGRLFQRLHEIFADGGFGRVVVPLKSEDLKLETLTYETVLVEPSHTMACKLPPGNMGTALATLMKDTGCQEDFKYPALDKFAGAKQELYPLYYFLVALNTLAITDENIGLTVSPSEKEYPVEIMGMESGIKFVIAPRVGSGD